jgi:plastocyanin
LSIRLFAAVAILASLAASVRAASTIQIDQRGLVFNVSSKALHRGDRLVFTNSDDVIHNIHIFTGDDDDLADLGLQKPGVKLTQKFDAAGRFIVRCNIHPSMKMVVTVK